MAESKGNKSCQLEKDKDLMKCVLCQKKRNKGETKLTSTSNGRSNLIAASTTLNDDFLTSLEEEERSTIVYHVKTC